MSHYTVLVIGDDIEGQLAPFDENIDVPEYCSGEVSLEDQKRFKEFYTKEDSDLNNLSLKDLYNLKGKEWNFNAWRMDSKGVWNEYSNYNPDSKWDWYAIGGRWEGKLELKNRQECNSAFKKDIVFPKDFKTYAVLNKGVWSEAGAMGWFGMSKATEEDEAEFDKSYFEKFIKHLPEDTRLTIVDCHI